MSKPGRLRRRDRYVGRGETPGSGRGGGIEAQFGQLIGRRTLFESHNFDTRPFQPRPDRSISWKQVQTSPTIPSCSYNNMLVAPDSHILQKFNQGHSIGNFCVKLE